MKKKSVALGKHSLVVLTWTAWAIALLTIVVRVWFKPGSHSVFTLFREAGAHWLNREALYATQGSKFLYSPLAAALFAPFGLLPENLAGITWRLMNAGILIGGAYVLARIVWPQTSATWKRSTTLLALLPLSVSNLNNGQANPLVLGLILFAIVLLLQNRWFLSALFFGAATYLKLYPIAIGLLLAVLFPWRMSWRLLVTLAGLFIVSLFLQHPGYVLSQYADWIAHLGDIHRRSADQFGRWRDAYFLMRMAHIPITARGWVWVELIAGIIAAAICAWGKYRRWPMEKLMFAAFGLGSAWMVLFGPASEASSYMLIAPAVIYCVLESWTRPVSSVIRYGSSAAYVGLLFANMGDSWLQLKGHSVYALSFQPAIATIFLVTMLIWLMQDGKAWQLPQTR